MSAAYAERALTFDCEGETLIGIIAQPTGPTGHRGVLIVVGGPQYRVGSHRQFLLLARYLAAHGIPCMRFDYRGMGDSFGDRRDFKGVDRDIGAAVDCFVQSVPEMREVVLWGLCDAASATAFYAHRDVRVVGIVLLNPWVRTQEGEAKAYLKHYYFRRLYSIEFWQRLFSGRFDIRASVGSLARMATMAAGSGPPQGRDRLTNAPDLPERMAQGIEQFPGRVMLILSGNDLTAREFIDATASPRWSRLLAEARVARVDLADANHTFSRREWRNIVADVTRSWGLEG
jgi:exosortase A-associated hydrolase 1